MPGTDYSQQSASQVNRVDLVIGAANSLTSVAFPFQADEVGNLIHVSAGTGFTPGFYTLASLVGAVVTLDRSPGVLASSGGTARVGGALSSPNDTPTISGGIVWMQGSFTTGIQYVLNAGVGDGNFVVYSGYGVTRGDNLPATITASGNLSPILTQADQSILKNLIIDGATLADRGAEMGTDCCAENVQVKRCNLSGMRAQNEGTRIRRCLFTACGFNAVTGVGLDAGTGVFVSECEASGCENGFSSSNGNGDFLECLSHNSVRSGFLHFGDDGMRLRNCLADANGLDGLELDGGNSITTLQVVNCLFTIMRAEASTVTRRITAQWFMRLSRSSSAATPSSTTPAGTTGRCRRERATSS